MCAASISSSFQFIHVSSNYLNILSSIYCEVQRVKKKTFHFLQSLMFTRRFQNRFQLLQINIVKEDIFSPFEKNLAIQCTHLAKSLIENVTTSADGVEKYLFGFFIATARHTPRARGLFTASNQQLRLILMSDELHSNI